MQEIVGYAKKGYGHLANGKEVIGGIRGDAVLLVPQKKPPYKIQEIIKPSPWRIAKACAHAPQCGGCSWQEMHYEAQLKEKEERLAALFAPHPVALIIPSPRITAFRGKMEFTFSEDKKGARYLGLILAGSRGWVENITECQVMPSWGNALLARVRAWWEKSGLQAYYPPKDRGHLRTLTLRSSARGDSKMVFITVSGNPDYALSKKDIDGFVHAASIEETISIYLVLQQTLPKTPTQFYEMHLKGPEHLEEELLGQKFLLSPLSFFQPNPFVAEKMFVKVREMLQLTGREKILDLYCGMGTVGALLAPYVRQVVGVELHPSAIADAKAHVERHGLENISFWEGDVQQFLERPHSFYQPDIIIVDPPRAGLAPKTQEILPQLRAKKIVYISCNPYTQSKDIETLKKIL